MDQLSTRPVHIDLIRTIAIVGVLLLHAAGSWIITPQQMNQMNQLEITRWAFVDIYQSVARIGVPLFLMLTGMLLLQPSKIESLSVFFKKRLVRIGLPFLFWGAIYFVWDFSVKNIPFSSRAIIQGILNGPYTQFWYLYLLFGLYLLTPILRLVIAHAKRNMIKYIGILWFLGASIVPVLSSLNIVTLSIGVFVVAGFGGSLGLGAYFGRVNFTERKMMIYFAILWFLGVTVAPVFSSLTTYTLSSNVFSIAGFAGYFILGAYLPTIQVRRSTLLYFMIIGVACTAIGTYVLAATVGGSEMYFFQQYFSPTIILTSIMAFMLLLTFKRSSIQKEIKPSKAKRLLRLISQNTLPIFLFHVIVMESLQNGYLGFAINQNTFSPIVEVPLMTAIVLFLSLAGILVLKRVPYLKKLIG